MNFQPEHPTRTNDIKENVTHAGESSKPANSLSSSFIDLMKETASATWSGSKTAWSDIASGKGTLGEYGVAALEVGAIATVGGAAALAAAPEVLAAGGVAAIGATDALSAGGLTAMIGGELGIVAGGAAAMYDDFKKRL